MIHPFTTDVADISLPHSFTNPFDYSPHPLSQLAWSEVTHYLEQRHEWHEELDAGKMFGVLVVRTPEGSLGFLAAFSGNLAATNRQSYFVPPVYDMLKPEDSFRQGERYISSLNDEIAQREESLAQRLVSRLNDSFTERMNSELAHFKQLMSVAKSAREERRRQGLSAEEEAELVRESQYQKAEYRRRQRRFTAVMERLRIAIDAHQAVIDGLKQERAERSAALQKWLFEQFTLLNARGESRDLNALFALTSFALPPAGAGECAAPKLLQYAYLHQLHPLCMAEYWWGRNSRVEARVHKQHYPACKGKCEPILRHMLQGLMVDSTPSHIPKEPAHLEVVYEDASLLVVNKPSGMLSVPGKECHTSVETVLQRRFGTDSFLRCVHRLDMDTSGLLVVARSLDAYRHLQRQFRQRTVHKQYLALVEGHPRQRKGRIRLPLCADVADRPRQRVDFVHGKESVTLYEVVSAYEHTTLVRFTPLTGRTHQLRVHAAHAKGLNTPIVGDALYGQRSERLHLHAELIGFRHPHTHEEIRLMLEAPF